GVEAPGKAFRQGKGRQHRGEAQQHLREGEALYRVKPLEQEPDAQQRREGTEELARRQQQERGFVLHGGAEQDGKIFSVQPKGIPHIFSSFHPPCTTTRRRARRNSSAPAA